MNQFTTSLRKVLLFMSGILLTVYRFSLKAVEALKEKDIVSNSRSLFTDELYID